MADVYDKKSHWHACKREVLDKRLKKIKDGDYSEFFDYSSDFWLALCISYFALSKEKIEYDCNADISKMFNILLDKNKNETINAEVIRIAAILGIDYSNLNDKAVISINDELRKQALKLDIDFGDVEQVTKRSLFFKIKYSLLIPEFENYGIFIDDKYSERMIALGNSSSNATDKDKADNFRKVGRNKILHNDNKIKISISFDDEDEIELAGVRLPLSMFINYTDAFCSPERYFRDGSCPDPIVTNDKLVDALGKIYRLYTANMHLMPNIYCIDDPECLVNPEKEKPTYLKGKVVKILNGTITDEKGKADVYKEIIDKIPGLNRFVLIEEGYSENSEEFERLLQIRNAEDIKAITTALDQLCAARNELFADQENVLAALVNVANINMFVINYEHELQNNIKTSSDANAVSLRRIMGNDTINSPGILGFERQRGRNNKFASDVIRNGSAHLGRLSVKKEGGNYVVHIQDKLLNTDTGCIDTKLNDFCMFLEHNYFEDKMKDATITNSDVVGIRQVNREIDTMLDESSTKVENESNSKGKIAA